MAQEIFPDDENGNILRLLVEQGDHLEIARDIDFSVVFPNKDSAKAFVVDVRLIADRTEINRSGAEPSLPWDVTVTKNMLPTHKGITEFEDELANRSAIYGGRNDGWGCFAQKRLS